MFRPVLVTAPVNKPIDSDDVKQQSRVDDTDSDTVFNDLIDAAVEHVDGWSGILGRCLITQTWRQDFAEWSDKLRLPFPDVQSVTVKYFDTSNVEQTVSSSLYQLLEDERSSYIEFLDDFTSPTLYDDRTEPVQITLVAGYGDDATDVPNSIKLGLRLIVGHWFENREAVGPSMGQMPMGASAVLSPYRRVGF